MGGFGARDEGVDPGFETVPEPSELEDGPELPQDGTVDPVRRIDLRRRAGTPPPDRARFADQVARAISAPSGGRVPRSRRPSPGPRPGPGPEKAGPTDAESELQTDPGTVLAPPQTGGFPLPSALETTEPGVRPGLRDAVFGPGPDAAENVPLPNAPVVVVDRADRVVRVNPAFLRLAAAHRGTGPLGLPLDRILSGPDTDAQLRRADGGHVRVRVVRWDLPAGLRAVLLVESAVDRRWTAELERIARVGTWSYDLATATLSRSPSLEGLYAAAGITPDGPQGPLEGEQVALLCRALRTGATGTDHHGEIRLPGDQVLSCRAGVERGPDGVPVRLTGMIRDVTAQRLAEGRARQSGQRFADLMSTVPDGVALIDAAGRIAEVNAAFAALLDRTAEALRGCPVAALTDATPDWLRPGGDQRIDDVVLLRGDGTPVRCRLGITASTADDGEPAWLVVATPAATPTVPDSADELTGLPGRAAVLALADELLAGPGGSRVALVHGDLDDFARVNSALGYAVGDRVLADIAARLRGELPLGCTPARISADEFVVVCADHALAGGPEALAETVSALLRPSVAVQGRTVRMTASVGMATPDVRPGAGAGDLLRYAEVAMQQAKRAGRGGIVHASASVVDSADRSLELEAELRAALAEDRLALVYQPVVGPDGTVLSAEALVRWPHPERGTISPGEFLPVAERAGMMRELDLWVLRTAAREAAGWQGAVKVAVNLAGLLPNDPAFLAEVTAIVEGAGLAWDRLILELVETSLVALPAEALDAMAQLVSRGVRFAVDDFGTGYSSLARLKQLPAQTVKVDRAFVTGVGTDPADFAVARAVVDISRALGRTTVAEGVETAEQFHVLRGLGVDAYQGWLFSRPLAPEDLRHTLAMGRLPTPARAPGA